MLVIMTMKADSKQVARVCERIREMGHTAHEVKGLKRSVIAITGNDRPVESSRLKTLPGVDEIVSVTRPYQLVSREFHEEDTVVEINGLRLGGDDFVVMAGPCSVESKEQVMAIAQAVAENGGRIFRGGAYKPRTSPYSFQGLGKEGLELLAEVREKFKLAIITEAVDTETIDLVAGYADIVQIGARNMQNYSLLKKAGRLRQPVLLKRGMWATIEEFLMSAEYIMAGGNEEVILCERGIRTSADHKHQVLDLASVLEIKRLTHLPIICDPSHSSAERYKVPPLARAALAAGADGLLIEVHHRPEEALSDGSQAITPADLKILMKQLGGIAEVLGRNRP